MLAQADLLTSYNSPSRDKAYGKQQCITPGCRHCRLRPCLALRC